MDSGTGIFVLGVVPVLVGPLQALLALLPALLVGLVAFLAALFTPAGFRRAARFFWRQKIFSLLLVACAASLLTGWPWQRLFRGSQAASGGVVASSGDWPMFRGDAARQGRGIGDRDPAFGSTLWEYSVDPAVYSSPASAGDLIIVSTAGGISPFNPTGTGAIVALDATSGSVQWRYAPDDYRATFSSPVVSDGRVVCGEGLHQVQDARVTCLDLTGRLQWEFRTASHVESTAAIADGRVFVGAGGDGFYCLDLRGDGHGQPRVLWRLDGKEYPDCESSPLVVDDLVIFGLGEGGQAVCAVDARTGEPRWRIPTPYPVFTAPTLIPATATTGRKLVIAMGNGNFVQTAAEILEQKLARLREAGASQREIDEAQRQLAPGGQIWGVDLETHEVDWRHSLDDTVLGSIAVRDGQLYFGCRDGSVHCLTARGQVVRTGRLPEPIVSSPALGQHQVYLTTSRGRLFALDLETLRPAWDLSLGDGENFTSSPVVAHGRVYVGSQQHGLLCVGSAGPAETRGWNRGDRGGMADQDALPTEAQVVGHWPAAGDPLKVDLPLTAVDGQIVAVARSSTDQLLVRLDFTGPPKSAARVVWQRRGSLLPDFSPLVTGTRLVTLEAAEPIHFSDGRPSEFSVPQLIARDINTGEDCWNALLPPVQPRQWTCDARRVYLVGPRGLAVFDAHDGAAGWSMHLDSGETPSVALADDLVLLADGRGWSALDSGTGTRLWTTAAEGGDCQVLDARGDRFLTVMEADDQSRHVQLRQVLDGRLIWQADWPAASNIAWGRLSVEHALVAANSGAWHVFRLDDGSLVDLAREESAAGGGGTSPYPRASAVLCRSRVIEIDVDGLRMFGLDEGAGTPWISFAETGRPATPLVGARGRLYFANDQGRIQCVGPRGATP